MRPRGLPRGCPRAASRRGGRGGCFNEAAGITPRMPHPRVQRRVGCIPASMRPRGLPRGCPRELRAGRGGPLAASMRPRGLPRGCRGRGWLARRADDACFNEAAGITPRMPPDRPTSRAGRSRGFNEAAGITPRMPPCAVDRPGAGGGASMRPRGLPRGCLQRREICDGPPLASMRPRGLPRGCPPACAAQAAAAHEAPASMRPRGLPRGCLLRRLDGVLHGPLELQ